MIDFSLETICFYRLLVSLYNTLYPELVGAGIVLHLMCQKHWDSLDYLVTRKVQSFVHGRSSPRMAAPTEKWTWLWKLDKQKHWHAAMLRKVFFPMTCYRKYRKVSFFLLIRVPVVIVLCTNAVTKFLVPFSTQTLKPDQYKSCMGKSHLPTNFCRLWRFLSSIETNSSLVSVTCILKIINACQDNVKHGKTVQMIDFISWAVFNYCV